VSGKVNGKLGYHFMHVLCYAHVKKLKSLRTMHILRSAQPSTTVEAFKGDHEFYAMCHFKTSYRKPPNISPFPNISPTNAHLIPNITPPPPPPRR
jgi:hypothetical protein